VVLARISHEHCVNLAVVISLWYFQQVGAICEIYTMFTKGALQEVSEDSECPRGAVQAAPSSTVFWQQT